MKGDEGLMGDDEDCGDVKVRKNREVLKVHEVHMIDMRSIEYA